MAGRIFSLRGSPFASSLPAVVGGRGGDGRSPPAAFRTSAQLRHHVGSLPSPLPAPFLACLFCLFSSAALANSSDPPWPHHSEV